MNLKLKKNISISEAIIKNCRGVKRRNGGINKADKESQRENFRILLGFKENDIFQGKEYSIVKKLQQYFQLKK